MKYSIKVLAMLAIMTSFVTFYACDDDDDDDKKDAAITLSSLTAGTIDLNGATSAEDVPVDASFTATFNNDIDATSAATAFSLTRDFDNDAVDVAAVVTGNIVTVTPVAPLSGGAIYVLGVSGLKDANGQTLAALERNFKTAGVFTPDEQLAYWNFQDNGDDQVGSYDSDIETDITYITGRNATAGKAASFNGTTSIIDIPNGDDLITSDEFSISFWIDIDTASRTSTDGQKGHFIMGVGAYNGLQFEVNGAEEWMKFASRQSSTGDNLGNDFFFNANGETATATGLDIATTVDADFGKAGFRQRMNGWAQVVFVFSATTKVRSFYINGELVMEQDYKLLAGSGDLGVEPFATVTGLTLEPTTIAAGEPDGYDNHWAFGWWVGKASTQFPSWGATCCQYGGVDNNHFKGALDDVRVWHRAITEEEIELMYDSEN